MLSAAQLIVLRASGILMLVSVSLLAVQTEPAAITGLALQQRIADAEMQEAERIQLVADALDGLLPVTSGLSSRDAAQLVWILGTITYSPDSTLMTRRLSERQQAFQRFKIREDGSGDAAIDSRLLILSKGMLGMDVDQAKLLRLLRNGALPPGVRLAAAEALIHQQSIIAEAKDVLIELSQDPYHEVRSCIGPPENNTEYPFRDKAYEGLQRLGVPCRKIRRKVDLPGGERGETMVETIIEIGESTHSESPRAK